MVAHTRLPQLTSVVDGSLILSTHLASPNKSLLVWGSIVFGIALYRYCLLPPHSHQLILVRETDALTVVV